MTADLFADNGPLGKYLHRLVAARADDEAAVLRDSDFTEAAGVAARASFEHRLVVSAEECFHALRVAREQLCANFETERLASPANLPPLDPGALAYKPSRKDP
eukprot:SAG11_NODE_4377_length_1925_cov_2.542716_2_plen_103_part_00